MTCPYKNCKKNCSSEEQHRAKYASLRRRDYDYINHEYSAKINYEALAELLAKQAVYDEE